MAVSASSILMYAPVPVTSVLPCSQHQYPLQGLESTSYQPCQVSSTCFCTLKCWFQIFFSQSHQTKSLRATCSFSVFSILPVIHDFPWKELMWGRISTFVTTSTVMWISLLTIQISASHLQLFPVHFLLLVTAKHSHQIFTHYGHNTEILIELVL